MRLADKAGEATNSRRDNRQGKPRSSSGQSRDTRSKQHQDKPVANNAFAAAFSNAKKGR
jgi:hypothetical protein